MEPATAAFEKFQSRHRWWTELRNAYEFSSCLQTRLVSVKQQWLLSYLKMQNMYSKWAFFWFNVWIGYAVKVLLLKQNFTARLDCPLKIHYSFDPSEPGPQQCTFASFLIGQDRNVADGIITSLTVLPLQRCLIGFMALRHIYLMLAKWNFFAFMRLSKLSIYPENNRPDFAISELLNNATRHPTLSLRGFESLNGNQTERWLSSSKRSRKCKYY